MKDTWPGPLCQLDITIYDFDDIFFIKSDLFFFTQSHGPARLLKCRYKTDNPILRLKPGKEEVVLVTPRVVIYHDMVRDADLERIKNVARPYVSGLSHLASI